tara:strand:- start:165 stop:452 length:288 start_codon:yes stop_codon:yes gene_type:complete
MGDGCLLRYLYQPREIDELLHDVNVKASIPICKELLSPSGSEPSDVGEIAAFSTSMQRQEQRKDGLVSRYSSDTYKLIGRQRSGITLLSRAIRQG